MSTTSKAQQRFRVPAALAVAIAAAAVAALTGASAWAQAPAPAVAPAKQRYVQGSWVNLRESAQSQARIVAQVPANTVLQQLTERDGWCAVLYAGDARLGPPLPEPLQAHIACNLLADQPLTLAQAGKDAARAFWVAPSPNRLRAYGNALPRPPALQLPALVKSHAHEMPVQYPTRAEWEAAKKLMRAGVVLRPEQEIDRDRPGNPLGGPPPRRGPFGRQADLASDCPVVLSQPHQRGPAARDRCRRSGRRGGRPHQGSADQPFAPALTLYAIALQGLVDAHAVRQR